MRFSVITVTYNDLDNLKISLESVRKQSFLDYEYIIIDGGSKDGTIEYFDQFSKTDNHIKFFSETDKGIYDAMNKGVSKAIGEYIIFLGAGDTFYSDNILSEVDNILNDKIDVLYGKVVFSSGENKGNTFGGKVNFFGTLLDNYVAHQSVFTKKELLELFPFNLNYLYLADQDFMLNVKAKKYRMKHIDKIISFYDGMGFSSDSNNRDDILNERIRLLKNQNKLIYYIRQIGHLLKNREFYNV